MEKKIWTAAELDDMTPAERHAISAASVVTDLDDAPPHLIENARRFVENHIATNESAPAS